MKENVKKCADVDPIKMPSTSSSSSCRCSSKFQYHTWIIYFLLAVSFGLHFVVLVDRVAIKNVDKFIDVNVVEETSSSPSSSSSSSSSTRPRRSVKGSGRDYSDAKVEFIHPKLRDEMDASEQQDPNNPWVWLTSYSRIPVKISLIRAFSSSSQTAHLLLSSLHRWRR